jgi:cell division protease FtsH
MSKFDKVVGYEDIKAELIRICDVVKNPEKYARLGVHMPRGIMLWGDPGLGKSLMAQCFIEESGCRSFTIRKDKPDGDLVNVICDVFAEAKAQDRAIIFLDDLDKFANEDDKHPDAEEYVAVQAGIDACRDSDVFVIATANDRYCLPDSLLRSGRFDKVIELECPKGKDALKVVQHYLSQKESMGEVDAAEITRILDGHSCADLETVVNEAGIYAGFDGRDTITQKDMLRAAMRMLFDSPECVAENRNPSVRSYAVHEAGHVVMAETVEPGSVTFVSVGGYVGKTGGVTKIYTEKDFNKSREWMEHDILIKLAGKAATEVVLGETDVGCGSDLRRAFQIIAKLADNVCAFGFDMYENSDSSDVLRARKEQFVAMELNRYYQRAKKILAKERAFLNEMITALLTRKTLTQQDIRGIRDDIL